MNCDELREDFSALIDDELSPRERARVAAHLESCAACRNALSELKDTDALLRGLPMLAAPRQVTDSAMRLVRELAPRRADPIGARLRRALLQPWSPTGRVAAIGLAAAALVAVLVIPRQPPSGAMTSGRLVVSSDPDQAARAVRELARSVGGETPMKALHCPAAEICFVVMVPRQEDKAFTDGLGRIGRWQVMQADGPPSSEAGFEVHISRAARDGK